MKLKYISWLPAVLIMGIIFYFSSKPAVASDESSLTIANTILNVYETVIDQTLQEDIRIETIGGINFVVRKGAHFTEYACLAVAIAFHLLVWKRKTKWRIIIPTIIAGMYAATDEFHQTFVLGRSGQIKDVLLDTSGAATGALLFTLVLILIARKKRKTKEKVISLQ
jgi:VanZ family protein